MGRSQHQHQYQYAMQHVATTTANTPPPASHQSTMALRRARALKPRGHGKKSETGIMNASAKNAAETLRDLADVARARNGRLEIDWLSRAQMPRWRMVELNGQWYDRDALRALLNRRPRPEAVPASRRALTVAELQRVRDPAPWTLLR